MIPQIKNELLCKHLQYCPCFSLPWNVMSLTFRGWVIKRLSKKETSMEMSQFMERSLPYVSPYIMVKYPDTQLVAITSFQPINTNHQGSPPWLHFLVESPLMLSSGLGLPSSWAPSRLDEGRWYSRRPFIPWTCCIARLNLSGFGKWEGPNKLSSFSTWFSCLYRYLLLLFFFWTSSEVFSGLPQALFSAQGKICFSYLRC